jgi:hypothetical protein
MNLSWKTDKDRLEGLKQLTEAMQNLVHNIVSVVAVIALVHGISKIEPKHLLGSTEYLYRKCPLLKPKEGMQRGGSFPLSYFGGEEPMYLSGNGGDASADTIDYQLGLARSPIHASMTTPMSNGMMGGASASPGAKIKSFDKWIYEAMKPTLEHHHVRISKMAAHEITQLSKHLLSCILKDIAKKSPISIGRVRKTLSKKTYDIFH